MSGLCSLSFPYKLVLSISTMMKRNIFWNVQGVGFRSFGRTFRLLCRHHSPNVVGIFEPRISGLKADDFIRKSRSPNSFRVEALRFSGGI